MVTQNPSKRDFLRPSVSLFLVFFDGVTTLYTASEKNATYWMSEVLYELKEKVFIAEDLSLVIRLGYEPSEIQILKSIS